MTPLLASLGPHPPSQRDSSLLLSSQGTEKLQPRASPCELWSKQKLSGWHLWSPKPGQGREAGCVDSLEGIHTGKATLFPQWGPVPGSPREGGIKSRGLVSLSAALYNDSSKEG